MFHGFARKSRQARFVGLACVLIVTAGCSRAGQLPAPEPDAAAAAQAFNDALTAADVERLKMFFAGTVWVESESGFAGAPPRSGVEVTGRNLEDAYARIFASLGPDKWKAIVGSRRPLLNIALKDGHHCDFAKAGDYVYELGRPGSDDVAPILVFVFRRTAEGFRLVGQQTDF